MAEGEITQLLAGLRTGEAGAQSRLMAVVYDELHRMARRQLRRERPDHTLQPTALVNEAYLRLLSQFDHSWESRAQFFAVAAQVMRHILVDYARGRRANKRGGLAVRVDLENALAFTDDRVEEILMLDQALTRLAQCDARQCRIVELRFFVGLQEEEISRLLGISERTVKRDWRMAKAWLYGELQPRQGPPEATS